MKKRNKPRQVMIHIFAIFAKKEEDYVLQVCTIGRRRGV